MQNNKNRLFGGFLFGEILFGRLVHVTAVVKLKS